MSKQPHLTFSEDFLGFRESVVHACLSLTVREREADRHKASGSITGQKISGMQGNLNQQVALFQTGIASLSVSFLLQRAPDVSK